MERRRLRLPGYDYRSVGCYFVTICTAERRRILARRYDDELRPTRIGDIVHQSWREIPDHYRHVCVESFVLMPDHVHGILAIGQTGMRQTQVGKAPLGTIIGSFKAAATRAARVECDHFMALWQRGYHDRIIRTERDYQALHQYILANPARWLTRERRVAGP